MDSELLKSTSELGRSQFGSGSTGTGSGTQNVTSVLKSTQERLFSNVPVTLL